MNIISYSSLPALFVEYFWHNWLFTSLQLFVWLCFCLLTVNSDSLSSKHLVFFCWHTNRSDSEGIVCVCWPLISLWHQRPVWVMTTWPSDEQNRCNERERDGTDVCVLPGGKTKSCTSVIKSCSKKGFGGICLKAVIQICRTFESFLCVFWRCCFTLFTAIVI